MGQSPDTIIFFNELVESVKHLGLNGVMSALKNARDGAVSMNDRNVDFVVRTISGYYNLSVDDVIDNRSKSFKRKMAVAFCVFYLYEVFQYSLPAMSVFFQRDKSRLSRYKGIIIQGIENKDKSVIDAKMKLDSIINKFINNQNL